MSRVPGEDGIVQGWRQRGRLPCQACGTWTCPDCGWQRYGANLHVFQDCPRCGGGSNEEETFRRTRHHSWATWADHNPAIGPRCEGWGDYRISGLPCTHRSCRVVTWENAWEEWGQC